MRNLIIFIFFLLVACDQKSPPLLENKGISMDLLANIKIKLDFTCKYEIIPESFSEVDVLFKYARWLQKNNILKQDKTIDSEIERLYRIAAENNHYKANINLQNGSMRGQYSLTANERLRFSQQLIDAKIATGYYLTAIYLQHGVAGVKEDQELALRYYRKAADEGNSLAQNYIADKLSPVNMAPEVAVQMFRCAAEQGSAEAANALGNTLAVKKQYQRAAEAFQMGVAAGDSSSARFLANGFNGPAPTDQLYYLGQQKDAERASRYKIIAKVLSNYSYAHPTVPEINDIVPLPPAPLPAWDGKLKWLEAREANVQPAKPSEALIEKLAKDKRLNPETGRPLPASPDFDKSARVLLCKTGEPCPKSGYWQIAWLPREGISQNAILTLKQGDIMPADVVEFYRPRPWPFRDKHYQQEQHVDWRYLGDV
ncbi:sel1 repeat family protein [Erwinia sp. Leaf53]|uniref:SEL1-like repeat protein n=1 Tax=Erwinia sp. Leaf53 TaxID=1736225 RepID=UPI0006FC8689|nr:DUF6396 domain-containing protein [Erwinia sp. Leaf53]KQN55799.1 hypothetical protein ASF13_09975 [Erwinia sp. Leaf53]